MLICNLIKKLCYVQLCKGSTQTVLDILLKKLVILKIGYIRSQLQRKKPGVVTIGSDTTNQ